MSIDASTYFKISYQFKMASWISDVPAATAWLLHWFDGLLDVGAISDHSSDGSVDLFPELS